MFEFGRKHNFWTTLAVSAWPFQFVNVGLSKFKVDSRSNICKVRDTFGAGGYRSNSLKSNTEI